MTDWELWEKIEKFKLDDDKAEFNFSKRLARDNNWSIDFAKEVVFEYKRFIYLCCVSNQQITPSDAVDQAWHLHLTYTQSYWKKFCKETLAREIHHNPTKGGASERSKFSDCYDKTFEVYESEFAVQPPPNIWLNNKRRFKEINFRRINLNGYWLIKKPSTNVLTGLKLTLILLIVPTLFIRANYDSIINIVLIVLVIAVVVFLSRNKRNKGTDNSDGCDGGCTNYDDDSGCDSGCSGCSGCGGCGD